MLKRLKEAKVDLWFEQKQLLSLAQRSGEDLVDLLTAKGWTYDDLAYENSKTKVWKGRKAFTLDDLRCDEVHAPVVSFFTGCGGIDLGFEAAGFQHIAAFEFNELFCKTLRLNRPSWNVYGPPIHSGDVSKFEEIAETLNDLIQSPFEGIFAGGPPCQPFSIASNQRFSKGSGNFKRTGFMHEKNGNLLFDYVRLIVEFKPRVFIIENVPGLRDLDGGEQLSAAVEILQANDYFVNEPLELEASDYGVPQNRRRLFVIGTRGEKQFLPPSPALEKVGSGSVLSNRSLRLPNSETREHFADSIARYVKLDYGQRDQLGRVDRLNPLLPSKTVIAGGTNGGGRSHLHPEVPRTLSVRECARLQTFPDDFVFAGPSARQFTQVGNAVPPVLAAQLGLAIKNCYF
jgi:DNA (cytosine-5)-methyltransferase 1